MTILFFSISLTNACAKRTSAHAGHRINSKLKGCNCSLSLENANYFFVPGKIIFQ